MNVLQWKFTSCRQNQEGATGFYTFSMSEGITDTEKHELISHAGTYTPPSKLPYQPTSAEIESLFPIAFSFFKLSSGRYAITSTRYIGQEYGGVRWGNFFSHGLVLASGRWPFYPLELWGSPSFAMGLSEQEIRLENKPAPLPSLPLQQIEKGEVICFESVQKFLSDDKTNSFGSIVNAVLDFETTRKPLAIAATSDSIHFWLASIQYGFSLVHAHELSLTTYSKNPFGGFQILGTTPEGSSFQFGPSASSAMYVGYNLADNIIPTSSRPDCSYLTLNPFWRRSREHTLSLYEFHDLYENLTIGKDLQVITTFYDFLRSEQTNIDIEDLRNALNLTLTVLPRNNLADVAERILLLHRDYSKSEIESITLFLLRASSILKYDSFRRKIVAFFSSNFFSSIIHGRLSSDDVESILSQINAAQDGFIESDWEDILDGMGTVGSVTDAKVSLILLLSAIQILRFLSVDTNYDIKQENGWLWKELLLNVFSNREFWRKAALPSTKMPNLFAFLTNKTLDAISGHKQSESEFHAVVSRCLSEMTWKDACLVRIALFKKSSEIDKAFHFLMSDFSHQIAHAKDSHEFVSMYYNDVFLKVPAFKEKYLVQAVETWMAYDKKFNPLRDGNWILSIANDIRDANLLEKAMILYQEALPLKKPGSDVVQCIDEIKGLKQRLFPHTILKTDILKAGLDLLDAKNKNKNIDDILNIYEEFFSEPCDNTNTGDYLHWVLLPLVQHAVSPEHHERLFKCFATNRNKKQFIKQYIQAVARLGASEWKRGELGPTSVYSFWEFYLQTSVSGPVDYVTTIREALVEWTFLDFKESQFMNFRNAIMKKPFCKKSDGQNEIIRLEELYRVSRSKRTTLSRFLRWFKK